MVGIEFPFVLACRPHADDADGFRSQFDKNPRDPPADILADARPTPVICGLDEGRIEERLVEVREVQLAGLLFHPSATTEPSMHPAFETAANASGIPIIFATKATWETICDDLAASERQFALANGFADTRSRQRTDQSPPICWAWRTGPAARACWSGRARCPACCRQASIVLPMRRTM